jgi:predicted RNA binding protein YcfA (HicA-like mRNA interferase family)
MPKARRVRRALERRFELIRQRGSHGRFRRDDGRKVTFAYHDGIELSDSELRDVAADFGINLDELKSLL